MHDHSSWCDINLLVILDATLKQDRSAFCRALLLPAVAVVVAGLGARFLAGMPGRGTSGDRSAFARWHHGPMMAP